MAWTQWKFLVCDHLRPKSNERCAIKSCALAKCDLTPSNAEGSCDSVRSLFYVALTEMDFERWELSWRSQCKDLIRLNVWSNIILVTCKVFHLILFLRNNSVFGHFSRSGCMLFYVSLSIIVHLFIISS